MKKLLLIIYLLIYNINFAQSKYNLQGFELQLETLMNTMFSSENASQKFNANEEFIDLLEDALNFEKSFSYPFLKLDKINILTSKDKQFRIFTWSIKDDEGYWENYGMIQSRNNNTKNYEIYRLLDKSEECFSPEHEKLSDSIWFGAVYYELIEEKYENRTYYVLLGWDGKDIYSKRKVIEPISFKNNSGKPIFGQTVFYKEKERMRYIFEYSTDATFTLKYDNQYYEIVKNEKAKSTLFRKAKPFETVPNETKREKMIFFDDLEPMTVGMDGLHLYYIPSGEVIGLYFEAGKWKKLKHNVLPRNKTDKKDDYTPNELQYRGLFPQKK